MPAFSAVAVKPAALPAQIVSAMAVMVTVGCAPLLTVMVTALDVTWLAEVQAALLVSLQVTTLPLSSVAVVKVLLLVPVAEPFTNHWYTGVVPPLVAVAVNVSEVPWQIVVAAVEMLTVGVTCGVIVTATLFDSAVAVVTQAALLVRRQLTTSLFARVAELKVALLVPAGLPFTYH